ncbi:hypothetical protein HYDPIDRAFT_28624 [Hydnomerulius pinastri MD-312]|uniref:Protein kinase domain-containing protein n=1 Tax=Hydnomerulius pinastri MD-312 TaxID=994086 RepID=A0A0C9W0D7_9AGAM|nr:hypothetical protein HYDPIDRAFT_28624 [Hydnomerulius pinastri MD-312]
MSASVSSPLVLNGHTNAVVSLAFLANGDQVISGSWDSTIRTWSVENWKEVGKVMKEGNRVLAVTASGDGRYIASGGYGKKVVLWDPRTHEMVIELDGSHSSGWVRSLSFSPDSTKIACGSNVCVVNIWDMKTGERLAGPFEEHPHSVLCFQFNPNGDTIASCGGDIRIWSSHTGKLTIPPIISKACPRSLGWSLDGGQLFVCDDHGFIRSFDPSNGSLRGEWKGHSSTIWSIAVSPNGKWLASASKDKTVCLWNVATQDQAEPTLRLQHNGSVNSMAISPDSRYLASTESDKKVLIWNLDGLANSVTLSVDAENPPLISMNEEAENFEGVINKVSLSRASSLYQAVTFPVDRHEHEAVSPRAGLSTRLLATPATTFAKGKMKEMDVHAPELIVNVCDVNSGGREVKNSSFEAWEQTERLPWNIDDIRSHFASDLTGSVTRLGEHPIADGGFAHIYQGIFRMRGKSIKVAIKAIRTYVAEESELSNKEKQLRREIQVWLNLDHPNIVPLLGTTMNFAQLPALVCPFFENGSLTSYLERQNKKLTPGERLVILGDIAMGLQYLHSKSIVHGDLSGGNVLIRENGRACLTDFGLSTRLSEWGGTTSTTPHGGGTLRWGAPEHLHFNVRAPANGEDVPRASPSLSVDIYPFGGIMLQACRYFPLLVPVTQFYKGADRADTLSLLSRCSICTVRACPRTDSPTSKDSFGHRSSMEFHSKVLVER